MREYQYYFLIGRNINAVKPIFIGSYRFGLVTDADIFNWFVVFIEYDSGNFSGFVLGKSGYTER